MLEETSKKVLALQEAPPSLLELAMRNMPKPIYQQQTYQQPQMQHQLPQPVVELSQPGFFFFHVTLHFLFGRLFSNSTKGEVSPKNKKGIKGKDKDKGKGKDKEKDKAKEKKDKEIEKKKKELEEIEKAINDAKEKEKGMVHVHVHAKKKKSLTYHNSLRN